MTTKTWDVQIFHTDGTQTRQYGLTEERLLRELRQRMNSTGPDGFESFRIRRCRPRNQPQHEEDETEYFHHPN